MLSSNFLRPRETLNRPPTPLSTVPPPLLLWPLIATGIAAISLASILIRLADAPSLAIAAYRVAIAAILLIPYHAVKMSSEPRWSGPVLGTTLLAGFFLALHFAFWVRSLQLTSIASSATLVSTTPLFVALYERCCLRRQLSRRSWCGISLVIVGSILVAENDFGFSKGAVLGDLLALAGALTAAGYLLAGRSARRTLDPAAYTFGAYGSAALFLLAFTLMSATPLHGFSHQTYLILLLLAVVPQLIGHTTFNWALGFLPPTTVAVLILGEPIGATLLAYLIFGETISLMKAVGLLVVGMGILQVATTKKANIQYPTRNVPS